MQSEKGRQVKTPTFPYCIPHRRELSVREREMLAFLLSTNAPDRLGELEQLTVIARCGCGQCPGVLFGKDESDEPVTQGAKLIADMMTTPTRNGFIGVMLWATDARITELELCSFGEFDITELPPVSDLKPFDAIEGNAQ